MKNYKLALLTFCIVAVLMVLRWTLIGKLFGQTNVYLKEGRLKEAKKNEKYLDLLLFPRKAHLGDKICISLYEENYQDVYTLYTNNKAYSFAVYSCVVDNEYQFEKIAKFLKQHNELMSKRSMQLLYNQSNDNLKKEEKCDYLKKIALKGLEVQKIHDIYLGDRPNYTIDTYNKYFQQAQESKTIKECRNSNNKIFDIN